MSATSHSAILSLALLLCFNPANAAQLGTYGNHWPIAEQDARALFEERAEEFVRTKFPQWKRDAIDRARAAIQRPPSVVGITHATEPRSYYIDPRVRLNRDIKTHDGTLVASAGTVVNPLDTLPLSKRLLFIDGDNDQQVQWAVDQPTPSKIILVAGRPLRLSTETGHQMFFDVHGALTARFAIKHVPATLIQDGSRLLVTETPLEDATQ